MTRIKNLEAEEGSLDGIQVIIYLWLVYSLVLELESPLIKWQSVF